MTQEGEDYHRAARGQLRISTTLPFGIMFVAPTLPIFMARSPYLTVELSFTDGIEDLISYKTDVGIPFPKAA